MRLIDRVYQRHVRYFIGGVLFMLALWRIRDGAYGMAVMNCFVMLWFTAIYDRIGKPGEARNS